MQAVLLIIHLMIAVVLIGIVLLQRSEGGALGIGGGGGGSFMTGRGAANALTRVTVGLAIAFFLTSIGLTLIGGTRSGSVLDTVSPASQPAQQQGQEQAPLIPLGNERKTTPDGAAVPAPAPDGGQSDQGPSVPLPK